MKKIIFLFLILLAFKGYSQVYQVMPQYGYQMPRADIQLVLKIPSDTTNNKTGISRIGSTLYAGDGTKWTAVAGGSGSGTDSSIVAGFGLTKNIASNVINLKVDTSAIATPYDLTVIDSKISNKILGTITSDAEDNKPSADLVQKSTNSYTRGWIDGQVMWVYNDTIRTGLGWATGNFIYDTIYRSTDGGATWQKESFAMPYPAHTVSYTQGLDGYLYIIGGDPFTTLTQRKTVSRSNNGGRTWETMTTTAPFQNILGSSWMDEKGNLYHGGGQNDFAGSLCDTLWKSTDGGANWTIYATGMTILAGNTSNLVKYVNGRCILASGGVYNPPSSTFTKKTYSFPIDNPKAWVEHSDVPSPTGLQYANAVVYDGKYWLIQGNDGSVNKNGVYYLDKNYNWNTYINYTDNVKANVLPISHANGITVHRNKIVIGVGNDFNNTYVLEPSKYQTFTHFRDNINIGTYSSISEVENSLSTLIGNNVKAGTTNNTIRRVKDPDEGNYYNQGLDGKWWGKLTVGVAANTDVADNTGIQMKLNNSNELIISTNAAYDAGNFRLQVDGDAHFSNLIRQPALAGNNRVPYIDANGDMNSNGNLFYSGTNLLQVGAGSMVYPSTTGFSSYSSASGASNGLNVTNTSSTGYIQLLLAESTGAYGGLFRWGSSYGGNYTGTSLPFANSFQFQSGGSNNNNMVLSAGALVHNVGVSSSNAAIRSDANGLRIGRNSNIHNANTVQLEVEGTILLNTGNQGAGKVLTSDASGNADWVTPSGGGGGVSDGDKGDVVVSASGATYTVESVAGELNLLGITSPSQYTTDQTDVSYTGSTIVRVSTNSDARIINSIAGGADGRMIKIINTGSSDLILQSDDGSTGTAANRFDFNGTDVIIEPKESREFIYDGTLQRWLKTTYEYDLTNLRRQPMYNWDYMLAGVATANFTTTAVASGTATYTNGTTDHPGYMQTSSSTTTNSGNHSYLYNQQNNLLFKGGEVYECIYQPRVASNTNTTTRFGFLDATTSADAVDGAYFEIPAGSFAVVGKTSNNSTRTTSSTISTIAVNTWYRFVIKVNRAASSITFTIYDANGVSLGSQTNSANIPTATGREFGVGYISTNVGTTATALGWLDYQAVQLSATKPMLR